MISNATVKPLPQAEKQAENTEPKKTMVKKASVRKSSK